MNATSRVIFSDGSDDDRNFALGPAERYVALALFANIVVVFSFVLAGWDLVIVGFGLALGLLAVFARMRLATPLFLAWVLVVLFAQDEVSPSQFTFRSQDAGGSHVWVLETAVMLWLIAVTRLHALTVGMFPGPRQARHSWRRPWRRSKGARQKLEELVRDPASCSALEHWTVPLWAVFWVLVAGIIVATLPAAESYAEYYGVDHRTIRAVAAAWLVVLLPALGAGGLAYARWRRLCRREAGVFLCSVLWRWNHKQQSAIARYHAHRKAREHARGR